MNLCFVPSFYLFLQEFLYFLFSQSLSSEHPPCVYRTLLPAVCVCVCVQKDQQNISALSGGRGKNHRASTRHWFTHKYVRNFCFSKTHPSLIGWSDLLGSDCCWGFVDWTDRSRALHCVIKKKKKKKEKGHWLFAKWAFWITRRLFHLCLSTFFEVLWLRAALYPALNINRGQGLQLIE